MKTKSTRQKDFVQKHFPYHIAVSKRGESALIILLSIFIIVAAAAGLGVAYKMYDQSKAAKKSASSTKKSSGQQSTGKNSTGTSGKDSTGSSGGSDSGSEASEDYKAAIAAYKELLSNNIVRSTKRASSDGNSASDGSTDSESSSGSDNSSGDGADTTTVSVTSTRTATSYGTGDDSGTDTDSGSDAGTDYDADSGTDSSDGSDADSGTDLSQDAGTDEMFDLDEGIDTDSGSDSDSGTDTDSNSGTKNSVDNEVWKPENCEFAIALIDDDDIPELLVYNINDAFHSTGYGELYCYDKNSSTRVKEVTFLSLNEPKLLGYYKKTGWYMDCYSGAGGGNVTLNEVVKNEKSQTVITKLLQNDESGKNKVIGYEISNGGSDTRQLNKTEYLNKIAEVTGGIPLTKYKFYKNTKENREKYLK